MAGFPIISINGGREEHRFMAKIWKLVKIALVLLLLVAAVLAGSQYYLPLVLERSLEESILAAVDEAESVRVEIEAFPALLLLTGRIPSLSLDVRQAVFNGLNVEAFLVDGENIVVDLPKLRQGEGLEIKKADSMRVSAVVAEADLNAYFAKESGDSGVNIQLGPETSTVNGNLSVLGQKIQLSVKGHFQVIAPASVAFVIDDILVAQARLPRFITDPLAGKFAVTIDLADSPIPLEIRDIRVADQRLYIYGQRPAHLVNSNNAKGRSTREPAD